MDMTLKDLSLGEIIDQLTNLHNHGCGHWKVRIVNRHGHKSCVGKILAAGKDDEGVIALFPVPEDIESVNSLTKLMAMMCCEKAMKGQECGSCPDLPTCEHMKRFDESLVKTFEGEDNDKVR